MSRTTAMRLWALPLFTVALLGSPVDAKKPKKAVKDCADCPEMVAIPKGSFTMGIAADREIAFGMPKAQAGKSEPLTQISFAKSFMMAKYPVTVAQFRTFVQETGYKTPESCTTQHRYDGHMIYELARGFSWRSPGFEQGDDYPVVCVTAEDAEAYAAWLSKKSGKKYALPNEAQYEYAARGGTMTAFFWADERSPLACQYSNQPDWDQGKAMGDVPMGPEYRFQCNDGYAWTSPVTAYKPNPWGLHDMQGNIWEWTADCWNADLKGIPTDGSTRMTGDCDARSSRGGSYGNAAFSSYVAIRAPRHATYAGHSWGFRVVRND
jgi:formylglycine-generating enzyme